mgnify:FL=1
MKDVVERSRDKIEKIINHMENAGENGTIKVENIPEIMLGYARILKNEPDVTSREICDYIDLLYENGRDDYSLYMLQNELKEPETFRGVYVFEAATYILKNQELDDNKEYTIKEIKNIFNKAFEGKEVTKEAELDI